MRLQGTTCLQWGRHGFVSGANKPVRNQTNLTERDLIEVGCPVRRIRELDRIVTCIQRNRDHHALHVIPVAVVGTMEIEGAGCTSIDAHLGRSTCISIYVVDRQGVGTSLCDIEIVELQRASFAHIANVFAARTGRTTRGDCPSGKGIGPGFGFVGCAACTTRGNHQQARGMGTEAGTKTAIETAQVAVTPQITYRRRTAETQIAPVGRHGCGRTAQIKEGHSIGTVSVVGKPDLLVRGLRDWMCNVPRLVYRDHLSVGQQGETITVHTG